MSSTLEVFLSYAREDEALRQELEKHLAIFGYKDLITIWHDRNISAGEEWKQEIHNHLETSQVILLLISPDFMASGYCYGFEMQHALKRHMRREACVIPIILRPVYWQIEPLNKLQVLPRNSEPVTLWPNLDAAFFDIAQGILGVIDKLIRSTTHRIPSSVLSTQTSHTSGAIYLVKVIHEHKYSLEQLKYSPHVYQQIDEGTKITAWLAAEGNETYIVDSITISHRETLLKAAGQKSGAVVPDADYSFPLIRNSTQTYALNPALVLSSRDHQEVSFTLSLAPVKEGSSERDTVSVILHYHSFHGVQGKLFLRAPFKDEIVLARLLKTDIEIDGFITTPKGFQRGIDEDHESYPYIDVLYGIREGLTDEERQIADEFVWNHFFLLWVRATTSEQQEENKEMRSKSFISYPLVKKVIKYLLWLGYSAAEIEKKLQDKSSSLVSKKMKDILERLIIEVHD